MMNHANGGTTRRTFLKKTVAAGTGIWAASAVTATPVFAAQEFPARLGFVGVGGRGTSMLKVALRVGAKITAVCDIIPERVQRAQRLVQEAGQPQPKGYTLGPEDYKRLCEQQDLDAVYTATPFELHTPVMLAAMKGGKYAASEMPICNTIDHGWELVETSEKTGSPCMLMENYCYMRHSQMILNMVNQNALGELSHCEVGYQHDTRYVAFDANGDLLWRGKNKLAYDGNPYPTHAIGPASQWLNINRGDRFEYLVSMSSRSLGLNAHAAEIAGKDHPSAKLKFKQGDVNTTMIRTHKGITITLYYDTQTPRPSDFIWRVQGTGGIYSGTLNKLHLHGRSAEHQWEDVSQYFDEFDHPNWKKYGQTITRFGHGGSDYLCMLDFVKAVSDKTQVPIDVYDAVTWSTITELAAQSVERKSRAIDFPDFTKGKWATQKPKPVAAI